MLSADVDSTSFRSHYDAWPVEIDRDSVQNDHQEVTGERSATYVQSISSDSDTDVRRVVSGSPEVNLETCAPRATAPEACSLTKSLMSSQDQATRGSAPNCVKAASEGFFEAAFQNQERQAPHRVKGPGNTLGELSLDYYIFHTELISGRL